MRRTFKYRARLSRKTEVNALCWLGLCRTLYNLTLEQRIINYREFQHSTTAFEQMRQLRELKDQYPEFKVVYSHTLQDVIKRVDRAFNLFFSRCKAHKEKAGFPRYRGADRYDSFTLDYIAGWKLNGKNLNIRGVGVFKLHLSRPIQGQIKTVTIKRSPTGRWYAYFSCDDVPKREFKPTNREVGIDVGLKNFAVDSDGKVTENPRFLRKSQKLLADRQRRLQTKQRGSNNRQKSKLIVAKTHEHIHNQREDFLHKTANHYIQNYNRIFIEDLEVINLIENGKTKLSKSITDASWGLFLGMLQAKAEEAAHEVIKVNPRGTSQICSQCGERVPKTLADRVHSCPNCGLTVDRDFNASLNILRLGQSRLEASCL